MALAKKMKAALPAPVADVLRRATGRLPSRVAWQRWLDVERELVTDGHVRAGPFEGLHFGSDMSWGTPWAFLIGSYELELHDAVRTAIGDAPDRVVDIGCAEGYYAVGFARAVEGAEVYAYDINPVARDLCEKMAARNGVAERVHVRGECSHEELASVLVGRCLLFSDCEGAELELLDPAAVPALADADMIVELHDTIDPRISRTILARFESTHDIELVDARERDPADHPDLATLTLRNQMRVLDELRPTEPHPMQWAVLRARADRSAGS